MAVEAGAAPLAVEVPRTLVEAPPPRLLGFWDQTAMWGNLGVSLLLPVAGGVLVAYRVSLWAGLAAIVVGAVIGNVLLGLAAVPGAETGAPAMVLTRGMFGWRGSWVPTAINIAQNVGWAWIEIVVIAAAATQLTTDGLRPVFVVAAGAAATLMAIRPLGVVRGYIKRVAVWVVLASSAYLLVQVLRQPLPPFAEGSWSGFWPSVDLVVSLPISWAPLAADYSRHSRSGKAAFGGALVGYGLATVVFFALGLLAVAGGSEDVIASLLAIPAGAVAMLILVIDEVDEVFANLYSTAVSAQNVSPRADRRVLALVAGVVATGLALRFDNWKYYEGFLFIIGSVFIPLFATFIVDYYVFRRRRWDTSENSRTRWIMLVPWVAGFVTYQLLNPGLVGWWADAWIGVRDAIGFAPPSWLSASLTSFAVAALLALVAGAIENRRGDVTS